MLKFPYIFIIFIIFTLKFRNVFGNENIFVSDQKNVCYIESEQKFSWYDGLARCASMNMSLVTIDTKRKSDDITALLKNTFGKRIPLWIGGTVNGVNPRQFVWIARGKKFVFTNWAPGQPDFAGNNEYCAQTGWTDNMEWNDHVCGLPFGFMCEHKQLHTCPEGTTNVAHHLELERVDLSPLLKQLEGRVVFRDFILNVNR